MRTSRMAGLRFQGTWRRYQQQALDAFDRDIADGRRRTHIVAPPGSGKTLLGVEIVRRLASPALVLAPNSAVQMQWIRSAQLFAAEPVAGPDVDAPIACLTYQSLCQVADPDVLLAQLARRRWSTDRAAATGQEPREVLDEADAWTGEAAKRRDRELSRITAAIKREVARGEHAEVELLDLLGPGAHERIEALRQNGVRTLVLDECHHLASLWGYVVRAVRDALGDVHVVGLTATPPDELTTSEQELYDSLLGPVDFQVPTPAVVLDGYLAPFQELAWFTRPLDSEVAWLAEHDVRFSELITQLHDPQDEPAISFPQWVITRMRYRETESGRAEVRFADFHRRHPSLARAGVRFLASAGLVLPQGAPRGERYRKAPDIDDWLVLLSDYALRCLAPQDSPDAARRYDEVAAALRDLGFQLTRQGIRRGRSDVDRLLSQSAAKMLGLAEVVAAELEARADRLRGVVLTDAEVATIRPGSELTGILDPSAGTAPRAVLALSADMRTAAVRPLLVSGRGLRCAPDDAETLAGALSELAAGDAVRQSAEPDGDGLAVLQGERGWEPRRFVALATRAFTQGATRVLVGTRAMLGEGWDAPCVNCLVDMSVASTGVSVRQMRGRSLRLDPADPEKVSSNWDVVCVAPELARGAGDYRRFVRKHAHLHAPAEDGTIEAGVSHVHPSLSPYGPPGGADFSAINVDMRRRAADLSGARTRWDIGRSYEGVDVPTVLVRSTGRARPEPAPARRAADRPPDIPTDQRLPVALAAAGLGSGLALALLAPPLAAIAVTAPAGIGWAAARLGRAADLLPEVPPLDRVGRAVAEAYQELGEISPTAAASLAVEPRTSGYLRCRLRAATVEESRVFSAALEDVLSPVESPRYLISRLVAPPGRGRAAMLARVVTGRDAFVETWHAVPSDLARNKRRATAFLRAWRRWLGPAELVYTRTTDDGRALAVQAAALAPSVDVSIREVWR